MLISNILADKFNLFEMWLISSVIKFVFLLMYVTQDNCIIAHLFTAVLVIYLLSTVVTSITNRNYYIFPTYPNRIFLFCHFPSCCYLLLLTWFQCWSALKQRVIFSCHHKLREGMDFGQVKSYSDRVLLSESKDIIQGKFYAFCCWWWWGYLFAFLLSTA